LARIEKAAKQAEKEVRKQPLFDEVAHAAQREET
jgi:hypothetical protein